MPTLAPSAIVAQTGLYGALSAIQDDPGSPDSSWMTAEEQFTGTPWYVRPSGSTYGSANGTSYADAWAGFAAIQWASIQPGGRLYVAGDHFNTEMIVGASGTSGSPVTIASCRTQYGASDEDHCRLFQGVEYAANTFSTVGSIYSRSGVSGSFSNFAASPPIVSMVFKKDSLVVMRVAQSLSDCEATPNSIYHNAGTSTLYYNPDETLESLIVPGGFGQNVSILQKQYVTLRGLRCYGSYGGLNGQIEVRAVSRPSEGNGLAINAGPSRAILIEDCAFNVSQCIGVTSSRANSTGWTANTVKTTSSSMVYPSSGIATDGIFSDVMFIPKTGGTTGSTEPTWNTEAGAETVDGTVTWVCVRNFGYAVDGLTVRNCTFRDVVAGIYLFDLNHDVTIESNTFLHTDERAKRSLNTIPGPYGWDLFGRTGAGGDASAVVIWGWSNNWRVIGNRVLDWQGEGLFMFCEGTRDRDNPLIGDNGNKGTIQRNYVRMSNAYESDWMMGIGVSGYNTLTNIQGHSGTVIQNNYVTGCRKSTDTDGFDFGIGVKTGTPAVPIKITNNTVVGCYRSIYAGATTGLDPELSVEIKNNIVSGVTDSGYHLQTLASGTPTLGGAGIVSDYNCFHGAGSFRFNNGTIRSTLTDWRTDSGEDANSITSDPLLDADGIPAIGSPVINAGTDTGLTVDLAGNPRPVGAYDMGAYERQ